jgi:hypothetical protein
MFLSIEVFEAGDFFKHPHCVRDIAGSGASTKPHLFYGTGHGFTPQISLAYSAIVRSLENFPDAATFRMAFRAHFSGSA